MSKRTTLLLPAAAVFLAHLPAAAQSKPTPTCTPIRPIFKNVCQDPPATGLDPTTHKTMVWCDAVPASCPKHCNLYEVDAKTGKEKKIKPQGHKAEADNTGRVSKYLCKCE